MIFQKCSLIETNPLNVLFESDPFRVGFECVEVLDGQEFCHMRRMILACLVCRLLPRDQEKDRTKRKMAPRERERESDSFHRKSGVYLTNKQCTMYDILIYYFTNIQHN